MKNPNRKPHFNVTAGLIRQNGRILITKRAKGTHLEGFWEFPGGKQEKGETLKACLEREIEEELGIKIKANRFIMSLYHDYGNKLITLHVFDCILLQGEPNALESQEFKWTDPVDLSKFSFSPPDKKIIEFLVERGHDKL